MRSIERTLLAWILSALGLGGLAVALVTYVVTLDEMHEVFDEDLKNVAKGVAAYHHSAAHGLAAAPQLTLPERTDIPDDSEIVTITWTPSGQRVFTSDTRVRLPFSGKEGLSRPVVEGEEWVVYTTISQQGVAQAAQRMGARQEMASESAAQVIPPLIGLVVLVGGLLVFGLRRGLQPLDAAAQDVAKRSARSLEPILLKDAPVEIGPLVQSINGLMARLGVAFASQRRFLADAAHELRTPVTALRLQLQLLERARNDAERAEALGELKGGIDRSQRLVEQLLQVARAEPDVDAARMEPVDLAALARAVVATLSVKADALDLDLGADAPAPVSVVGDGWQLTALIENLVDNALRYTPAGGVIDVRVFAQDRNAVLQVIDNGPGIPVAERRRVFDRFYRGDTAAFQTRDNTGTGLGLSIVKAIAERHSAVVELKESPHGRGLLVEVTLAAASEPLVAKATMASDTQLPAGRQPAGAQ